MKIFRYLIFAVIISFVCVNCGFAAEISSDEKIDLRKTDEERQADFDKALSELSYDVTELDKVTFEDGLKRSKNNFTRLYRSQWKNLGMTEKLERAVNTAFDENTKDLLWGTTGVQLAIELSNFKRLSMIFSAILKTNGARLFKKTLQIFTAGRASCSLRLKIIR